ncbi:MAG: hypothetical protein ACREL6_12715 [Gemmatimonadales bacterium]
MRSCILVIVSLLVLAGCAAAQANPDSIKVRNNCRLAARIIATGHPAPHEEWAFGYIGNCPAEAGEAIASGMRASRTATDTILLSHLTYTTRFLRDAALLDAALEVASDPSASFEARIFSLRSLLWLMTSSPSPMGFGTLVSGDPYDGYQGCWVHSSPGLRMVAGTTPLPADYRDQIRSLATRLEADSGEVGDIRRIAWCLKH